MNEIGTTIRHTPKTESTISGAERVISTTSSNLIDYIGLENRPAFTGKPNNQPPDPTVLDCISSDEFQINIDIDTYSFKSVNSSSDETMECVEDIKADDSLLDDAFYVDGKDQYGQTALMLACEFQDIEWVNNI